MEILLIGFATIQITNLQQVSQLSRAYTEGAIKLNISKLARELKCDRKTLTKHLNGFKPK